MKTANYPWAGKANNRSLVICDHYPMAEKPGVSQSNISFWESWDKPPRGEVLPNIAAVVGASVDELLGLKAPKRKDGPSGKVRQAFEAVSKLPRRQQEHIVKVVHALVAQASGQTQNS